MSDQQENAPATETRAFEADVARLLHLMVHSVYSNKDVFLRELISNAADACEKLRYRALTDPSVMGSDSALKVVVEPDKEAGRLTIADNGIGMSREDLVENLGTIARSGTRAFLDATAGKGDGSGLIGQFGVGFYSAFMVASEVVVTSRAAGSDEAWTWRSDGTGSFTVEPAGDEAPARGTRVTLILGDESKEFGEQATVERIIRHYSAHVPVPVVVRTPDAADAEAGKEVVDGTALWVKPKQEISADEYKEFYHFVSGNWDAPALTIHYRAEGRQEYSVLLFVPETRPFDLFDPERKGRVRLYVRRVFITDDAEVLPSWLRFVRGVIDSQDLPLNLSREMLQTNPVLASIRKAVTNRVLSELEKMAENDADAYAKFWEAFGAVLKEGIYEDGERRETLYKLSRFHTTTDPEGWRSLSDYIGAMKENQTAIYYAIGDDPEKLAASPHLEGFRARGIEVLLLTDPVDSFWVQAATDFEGKPLQSVTQGKADLDAIPLDDSDTDKPEAAREGDLAALTALFKQELGDRVSDVRPSERLATSPACLVAPDLGPDRQFERLMARQSSGRGRMPPVLELNPRHPLVRSLSEKASAGGAASELTEAAFLLLASAEILDGEAPSDPADFNKRLLSMMEQAFAGTDAAASG
ncbi:molecular chaperone HtpG [Amorphus orientalis]|uniref:Chaperone protein HtpG n=1 Tax=Amorphus orientalis TaxID=649198 RepID=A0AAE3VSB4_9HYPH|nr:molecular chaperone HtpG [Amorphus orientalis]MDQ0317043.1 molecular chaperone HtpG [Amorphus orientalis]